MGELRSFLNTFFSGKKVCFILNSCVDSYKLVAIIRYAIPEWFMVQTQPELSSGKNG